MTIIERGNEYRLQCLDEGELAPDPISQFGVWFDQAVQAHIPEPNAMALATTGADGHPSVRMVLLKGFDAQGFFFFSNYESRKGRELAENPWAALAFYWHHMERQVRVEGVVERLSAEESDRYFQSRPLGSRLGAWASQQSQVISGRDVLDQRLEQFTHEFAEGEVPRPPCWGGYQVRPHMVEFWQGRSNRLHDRLRYRCYGHGWLIERLAP